MRYTVKQTTVIHFMQTLYQPVAALFCIIKATTVNGLLNQFKCPNNNNNNKNHNDPIKLQLSNYFKYQTHAVHELYQSISNIIQ